MIHRTRATQAELAPVFRSLLGDWRGNGTLMGRAATFEMSWQEALDGRFVRLDFTNAFAPADDGAEPVPVLTATAYYRVADDGAVTGTWVDTRGMILPLRGTATESELVIEWGDETTERGRTTYRIAGPESVEVVDEVLADGEYGVFGRATYTRSSRRS